MRWLVKVASKRARAAAILVVVCFTLAPYPSAGVKAQSETEAPSATDFAAFASELSPQMVQSMREIAERGSRMFDNSVSRVGDSATVNWGFLRCFGMNDIHLDRWAGLQETIDFFRSRHRIFRRDSLAAGVGWSSPRVLTGGRRAPLYEELRTARPRFALLHFGGNDMQGENLDRYAHWMWAIVDRLSDRGVIPILTTIMPRGDDPEKDALVPVFNAALRALAQGRRLPLIDLHGAMSGLPRLGLAGDGQHPNSYIVRGQTRTCDFREPGLRYGNNVRNLVTMIMLDRLRRQVIEDEPPSLQDRPPIAGVGSGEQPWRITTWPFLHTGDTRGEESGQRNDYLHEGRNFSLSGAEREYHFEFSEPTRLVAYVVRRRDVGVRMLLVNESASSRQELSPEAYGTSFDTQLPAGEYRLIVDGPGRERGEYLLMADTPGADEAPFRTR